ncbi:MAG: hypothetical protein HYV99_05015 [Betaproteobacteria bacterium]|nr:hypothetical protein [Betaproteobacteria bacterium]
MADELAAISTAREPDAPQSKGFGWSLAPIRWGGNLATDLRVQTATDQPRRLQQVDSTNIRAGTYIWQPWFAQVSGGFGLVTSRAYGNSGAGAADPAAADSNSTSVTGNGTLSVFPVSRFPFQARFERADTRASGELTNTDFTTTRIGLRQDYRPSIGNTNYSLSYDRSSLDSSSFGRDTLDMLGARMTKQFGMQSLDIDANRARNTRSRDGESLLNRLTARHSYRQGPTLSVESLASINTNDFRETTSNTLTENRSRFLQLNTFANWRPEEGSPLYVTGGGRVFQSVVDNNGAQSESRSLSGNVGANYQLSRYTTLSGSASITQNATDTASDLITTQGAGITYVPDVINLGRFIYNRNASGNFINQTGGQDGGRQLLTGQFGHNVIRSIPLGNASTLNFNLGQSYSPIYDSVTAISQTLLHSGGVSWSIAPSASSTAYVSLTGADSRRTGVNGGRFQLVNFQATGQIQFNRQSFGSANLTIQGTSQSTSGTPDTGFIFGSNGNVSYQHLRAFDVPQLRYYALYSVNETQFASRALGDINAPREQISQSLEQRLEYNLGRVEFRLSARVADINGRRNALIFFRMSRQFGNF